MKSYLYQSKEKRDVQAKVLRAQGYRVRRASFTNQRLHPMYVEDYPRKLIAAECYFGNARYKTHFPRLYEVEIISCKGG